MRSLFEIGCDVVAAPGANHSALDLMRYQRLSPDCHLLPGGAGAAAGASRKPAQLTAKPIKNHDADIADVATTARIYDGAKTQPHHPPANSGEHNVTAAAAEVVLQWGHNKRSRCSRSDAASARPPAKRRSSSSSTAAADRLMPPPPPPSGPAPPRLRSSSSAAAPAPAPAREPRPHRGGGGEERLDRPARRSPDKAKQPMAASNGVAMSAQVHPGNHHHHAGDAAATAGKGSNNAAVAAEKAAVDRPEWPRIFLSLSRKEKEDDFLAMRGTKLPQRPKKRAKNVEKSMQYCYPGMWLADLTRGRYEVREKKSVKKQKRRGLKGMESSDSE